MNISTKTSSVLLVISLAFTGFTQSASSKSAQASQCQNPFPSTYKPSAKMKYVNIPDLGITVRVPVDHRLVHIKNEQRYTFMTPPEYKSYQCSLTKRIDYRSFYPYPYQLSYTAIKKLKKQPLSRVLEEKYKGEIFADESGKLQFNSVDKLGETKINNIDFLTTPVNRGDPSKAWFTPRNKTDIVVEYSLFCDCGREYQDVINDLKNIKNLP